MRESMRVVLLTLCTWLIGGVRRPGHGAPVVEPLGRSRTTRRSSSSRPSAGSRPRTPATRSTITFYEKKNMFTTLRAAFTAGSGFPDVFYYDIDAPEFMAAGLAGRSLDRHPLGEHRALRQGLLDPAGARRQDRGRGRSRWRPRPTSSTSTRRSSSSSASRCPAERVTFTQEQFKDVVGKCAKAGYAAFATGAADRDWAAHYIPNGMLLDKLGADGHAEASSRASSPGRTRAWSRSSTTTRS